jgi:GAF domain-containing protein
MDTDIARSIAHAADQMHRAATVEETLELIVRNAAEALPGFDHIGVSTVEKGRKVVNRAATSALVLELDELQYGIPQGPCVDSLRGTEVVAAPHISHDPRWPDYVPQAVALGLKSQLAVRLHLADRGTVGGLNLYSTKSEDVAPADVDTAAFFAVHASIALGRARDLASMSEAVTTRQLIGQAVGVLMERYKIDEKAAQAFLWRASSHTNTKVRDIAATLVGEANEQGKNTEF